MHFVAEHMELEFRTFARVHNQEYETWFSDPVLDDALGPAWSAEELAEIFSDASGSQWSVFQDGELVSVVTIWLPSKETPREYVVSALAVKPSLRGNGYGRRVVSQLLSMYPEKSIWFAEVMEHNTEATRFWESLGWSCVKQPVENRGMYRYKIEPDLNPEPPNPEP